MDFQIFHKSAASLVIGLTAAFNTFSPAAVPYPSGPLNVPAGLASEKLPETVSKVNDETHPPQNLVDIAKTDGSKLELVTKEPEVPISQDVVFYTVNKPSPKPEVKQTEAPLKIEIVKEVSAEDNQPDKEKVDQATKSVEIPSPLPSPESPVSSNSERMFQMANEHRAKLGKPAFEKDERLCKIAQSRAPQIDGELVSGALHAGFKSLNLPYWATENIAAYQTIEQNFKFWISDYIHRIAVEGDHKYSCVACNGASCSQIFSSFVPK